MKTATVAIALCASIAATAAQAHGHRITHRHHYAASHHRRKTPAATQAAQDFGFWNLFTQPTTSYQATEAAPRQRSGGLGGRPAAWCGWEMRQLVGRDPGPAYNLAANWAHWGRPGAPGIGAVVVWWHHVGKIVGQQGGTWVVESGNDGHAVRTRPRSLAGVIAIRWG